MGFGERRQWETLTDGNGSGCDCHLCKFIAGKRSVTFCFRKAAIRQKHLSPDAESIASMPERRVLESSGRTA
jgi:hypothetical protein